MTVARILASKGRDVVTMQPHNTLRDVVDALAAKHIGALIITDPQGKMQGIVSERDVVRAIAQHGADALEDPVSNYMTKNIVTATEEESVLEVVGKMSKGRFRHMPIVVNDRLVGIVSVGDAIKFRLAQMEEEQSALREYIATA
ncbi:CBS domain-containing protein [Beijerinckia sp. L45]|uniref:CBS domain-containing protein n=1 Tax=Beijerinckia sp. L45 TaxID=1641855 RepID=UPI00131E749C|nr:CBS domain-containing protein [Beijerinckia sp. L45]